MAALDLPIDHLATAWKVLYKKWEDTGPLWNDPVGQSFEKNYLVVFESQTQLTLKEMHKLAQVIAEAQRRVL